MLIKTIGASLALFAAMIAVAPVQAETHAYEAGQVWTYQTAAGDEGSLVRIQEVDQIGPDDDPMIVVHISMIGVAIPGQPDPLEIGHLPVSRETLDASVTQQIESEAVFPDYREGVQIWKDAEGGVFTITLAEIAEFLREQMAPRLRHQPKN